MSHHHREHDGAHGGVHGGGGWLGAVAGAGAGGTRTSAGVRSRLAAGWRWWARSRAVTPVVLLAGLLQLLQLVTAGAAAAAEGPGTPGMLQPFDMADSSGVKVSQYELNIDHGGVTDPWKLMLAFPLTLGWDLYRWAVGLLAWLIDWLLQFGWVAVLVQIAAPVAGALEQVMAEIGLMPLLLTVAGVVGGLWLLRGGFASGVTELMISMCIASLATGALAHPVAVIAGPQGLLTQAQRSGVEVSAAIASGRPSFLPEQSCPAGACALPDDEELRAKTTGALIDNFVRTPHQLVNYGAVLGSDCTEKYTDVLKQGPWGDDSTPRERVGQCDHAYKDYADNPNVGQIISMIVLMPSAAFLGALALVFSFILIYAVIRLLYDSVKLVITLLLGIVPGAGRGALWHNLAKVGLGLVLVMVTTIVLSAYMVALRSAFAGAGQWDVAARFLFLDALVLGGVAILVSQRKALNDAAERMAKRLAAAKVGNGGGRASQLPTGGQGPSLRAMAVQTAALRSGAGRRARGAGLAGSALGAAGGGDAGAAPASTLLGRVAQTRAGRVGKFAAKTAAVAAMSTVGAPVYAPRAAKIAKTVASARGAVLRTRLRQAGGDARAFGQEYAGNLATAGRGLGAAAAFTSRVTGTSAVTRFGVRTGARLSAPAAAAAAFAAGPAPGGRADQAARSVPDAARSRPAAATRPQRPAPAQTGPGSSTSSTSTGSAGGSGRSGRSGHGRGRGRGASSLPAPVVLPGARAAASSPGEQAVLQGQARLRARLAMSAALRRRQGSDRGLADRVAAGRGASPGGGLRAGLRGGPGAGPHGDSGEESR